MDPDFEMYDEYCDHDAISCARGDYNVFEEREVFNDIACGEGDHDYDE